jgi:hypothetical protein
LAGADASGVEATGGVAVALFEDVENGLTNGLPIGSANRDVSAEQPESQIPTRPVKARRKMFRLADIAAQSVIDITIPTRPNTRC